MLTICYSLLTWIQGRKRAEVRVWVNETCVKEGQSLLVLRERIEAASFRPTECPWLESAGSSPSTTLTRGHWKPSYSRCVSLSSLRQPQTSPLCFNRELRTVRLLWEGHDTKALVISPYQIVELHDWIAFIDRPPQQSGENKAGFLHLLIEAEPSLVIAKRSYRKFWEFGSTVAWKCDSEFAIILYSSIHQVVELMHIFRLSDLLLEGGWSVYRVTTIQLEGNVGTLISRKGSTDVHRSGITPGDLRRLTAGIYDWRSDSSCGTPKNSLSKDTSKHNIPLISEESFEKEESVDEVATSAPLPNWYERSPKKKSLTAIHPTERPLLPRRKSSLSSLSQRSVSLASLFFCSKSASLEEEVGVLRNNSAAPSPLQTPDREKPIIRSSNATPAKGTRFSSDTLNSTREEQLPPKRMSLSTSAVETAGRGNKPGGGSGLSVKAPLRTGKPPNILILCPDERLRQSIATLLKSIIAADRYVIYEIRWDQLRVGGWAEQTALLVLSGPIPEPSTYVPLLLQFLGDGGRLFAWCSESPPFGLPLEETRKGSLIYASSQTQQLVLGSGWGTAKDLNAVPANFPRILETNDSEGTSRPLTAFVIAKSKELSQAVILQLDGGVLGGKAILSQVHFEESMENDGGGALLSHLLSGTLGLDCRKIKSPEYSPGFLLGDHNRVLGFLSSLPPRVDQPDLSIEFIPRGEKGSNPSHQLFPVRFFECPKYFSTLQYFDSLETRELGRVVIYSDVISSVMNVLIGRPLQHGLTVIAKQQTSGRGRGKNVWLSPEGSALFAVQLHVSWEKGIGRRLSLVQHLTALAIILAVPSHKEIGLRVKWPNDVYLGGEKIGGILVESVMEGKRFVVNVGVGLNVSNSYPTTSINAALAGIRREPGIDYSPFTTERLVARTLTELEGLLDSIGENGGLERTLQLYSDNWIHSGKEEVSVEVSEGNFATCRVMSIDEFGFLRVSEVGTGNTFSVQPDGNSFDIANRLISIKQ